MCIRDRWIGWAILAAILLIIPLTGHLELGPPFAEDKGKKEKGEALPWAKAVSYTHLQLPMSSPQFLLNTRKALLSIS